MSTLKVNTIRNEADGSDVAVNRTTSDGTILDLQKDGTTVGKIRSYYGRQIGIGSGDIGIMFESASYNAIRPADIDAGTASDNVIDLGTSGERFKDAYLSGGVYLGGTGSANYLDDYEEGSWNPTFEASGASWNYTYRIGHYVKVGSSVWVSGFIYINSSSTNSNQLYIINLPFTVRNTYAGVQNIFNASVGRAFNWATAPVGGMTLTGTTKFEVYKQTTSDNTADSIASDTGTASGLFFSLRYETDS